MGTSVVLLSVAGLAIGLRLYFGTTVLTLSLGPVSATLILALLWLLVSLGKQQAAVRAKDTAPICAAELADAGFGPLPGDAPSGASLYVDMLKRSLLNLIYYESSQALWIYGPDHQFKMTEGFDLAARAVGEDMPGNAMTMVGLKRLENIQACVETVLAEGVPGDLVECGACKGGACIFMRGLLKAGGDTKRKVFVADTFSPPDPPPPFAVKIVLGLVLYGLASIPSKAFQTTLCKMVQKLDKNFPPIDRPSEEMVTLALAIMKSVLFLDHPPRVEKGRPCVESHFARFGLLDEQVVLLEGWFADTLPGCGAKAFSVVRADGDTYESTIDALKLCYPKLSAGGFCIIDDYWSFDDCQLAVDEYRKEHGITAKLQKIDGLSCFWRKP